MPDRRSGFHGSRILRRMAAPYSVAWGTVTAEPRLRNLALLTFVNSSGNGLFATVSAVYYTTVLGFSIGFVAAALMAATLVAILGDLASGRIADRHSPRPVFLAGLVVSGCAALLLLLAHHRVTFIAVLLLISLGQGLCMSSNTALIRRVAPDDPALVRASLRSVLTLALSLGALAGGVVLWAGTGAGFAVAILVNAASFFLAAVLLARIVVPVAGAGGIRPRPLFLDRRFLVFSLANGVIGIYLHVLPFALPLWIARNQPDRLWIVGVAVATNALGSAILQVPASAGIASARAAATRLVGGAVLVAVAYLFFVSSWSGSWHWLLGAVALFLITHTAGEVLYTAGTMELLFRLAPEDQQGQYGAFYGISNGLMSSAAPAVLGAAILVPGGWAWAGLAVLTVLLALVIFAVSRSAATTGRPGPGSRDRAWSARARYGTSRS